MQRTALQRTYCHWAPNTSACSPACRGGARRAPLRWLPRRGSWLGAAAVCCVSYVFAAAAAAVHPARCLAWQQLGQARAPLAAASALGAWLHRDPTSPCTQQQEPAEAPPCMRCATRHARPRTYCVAARAFGTGGVPRRQQRAAAAIGAPVSAGREQAMRAAHATRPAITGPTLASSSSSSTACMARRPATEGVLGAAVTNGACRLRKRWPAGSRTLREGVPWFRLGAHGSCGVALCFYSWLSPHVRLPSPAAWRHSMAACRGTAWRRLSHQPISRVGRFSACNRLYLWVLPDLVAAVEARQPRCCRAISRACSRAAPPA